MVDYQSMRNTYTVHLYTKNKNKFIKYKKKPKLSWKMALPPESPLVRTKHSVTTLVLVYISPGDV